MNEDDIRRGRDIALECAGYAFHAVLRPSFDALRETLRQAGLGDLPDPPMSPRELAARLTELADEWERLHDLGLTEAIEIAQASFAWNGIRFTTAHEAAVKWGVAISTALEDESGELLRQYGGGDLDVLVSTIRQEAAAAIRAHREVTPTAHTSPPVEHREDRAAGNGADWFDATENYRSVQWGSQRFGFSESQAVAVRMLHEAYCKGWGGCFASTIGAEIGSVATPFRLDKLFRITRGGKGAPHPAWDTMIKRDIESTQKARFRLSPPPSEAIPE